MIFFFFLYAPHSLARRLLNLRILPMSCFLPFNLSNYFNSNPADRAARKAERARVRKIVKFEQQLRAAGYKVDEDEDDVELKQAIARAEAAIKKTFGPYEV